MSDPFVPNIICFQTKKQLTTLNNIRVLRKGVLIDLRARNFVHAKTSLRARCVQLVTMRTICRALDMARNGYNFDFSFWAAFCPFIPLTARKIKP